MNSNTGINNAFDAADDVVVKDKDEQQNNQIIHLDKQGIDKIKNGKAIELELVLNENKKEGIERERELFVYKEGGWGWIVVIATAYCFGILIGMVNNYALIYQEFVKVYNGTENHVVYAGWIGSVSLGIQFLLCPLGSIFVDLYGPKRVGIVGGILSTLSMLASVYLTKLKIYFITYGFIYGIGQAFLLASTLAILPHYFSKRLSLANGLMNAFAAILIVILPIVTEKFLESYGLIGTFYFLSALNFITIVMSFTYIPLLPVEQNLTLFERIKQSFGLEVFKKSKFNVWCFASFIGIFGYLIPIITIDHYAKEKFPESNPVLLNVAFGASSGFSALLFGKIGDYTKFNRVHYHTITYLIYGLVQIIMPFAESFIVFIILFTILGIADGIFLCFIVPIACDLAESSHLANQASGYYHSVISVAAVAGPVVSGLIFQKYKKYDDAFYLGGISCLICALILIVTLILFGICKKLFR